MTHATDIINHVPEAGGLTPVEKAGGKPLDIRKSMEVFGSKVYWHTHKSKRSKVAPTKTEGIWVGRSNTVLGGHRVLPLRTLG